jgi:S1-C subfamily serine protease
MRSVLSIGLMLLLLSGSAFAQGELIAEKVAAEVTPNVVSIDSNSVSYGQVLGGFIERSRQQRLATSYLTGFIYTKNGYIITDSMGIEEATLLTVRLNDNTELEAKLVGVDPEYGVGVIKVDPSKLDPKKPLVPAKIVKGRYDPLDEVYPYDQGDPVLTVGYSGGYGGTVTSGIISAVRNFRNRNGLLIPHVIQSDAVVNAGNEGCPLFNKNGEIIAIHDRRGGGGSMQNTTFFTPIWLIVRAADEIIACYEKGKDMKDCEVWHPWLGVKTFTGTLSPLTGQMREVGDDLKMYMDIPDQYWDTGILLDSVWTESPAAEFGLLPKDMLLDVQVLRQEGQSKREVEKIPYRLLKSVEELEVLVTTAERGDIFVFGVLRNYNYFKVEVPIGQHPGAFASIESMTIGFEFSNEYF